MIHRDPSTIYLSFYSYISKLQLNDNQLLFFVFLMIIIPASLKAQLPYNYILPVGEEEALDDWEAMATGAGDNVNVKIGITVNGAGAIIYYDHWEDGLEADITNPVQSTTVIWGDGDISNGTAPGFSSDLLSDGDYLTVENSVFANPRSTSTIAYDGKDKISATRQIVITKAAWPVSVGTVQAMALDVPEMSLYGLYFEAPVGENLTTVPPQMYEHTSLYIIASEDNTTLDIDKDNSGAYETTVVLSEGEVYHQFGGVFSNARVNSDKPISVSMVAGDVADANGWENRWLTLTSIANLGNDYICPVSSAGITAKVFIHNHNSTSISITYQNTSGSGSFSVPANSVVAHEIVGTTGTRFTSSGGETFQAFLAYDANNVTTSGSSWDWGMALMPVSLLKTAVSVGLGIGSNNGTANGSPVWVTVPSATTLYIDYDGDINTGALTDPSDRKYDANLSIGAFESVRLYDNTNSDNDQSKMRVYTIDGTLVAAAWGQDATIASTGSPYLDMGTIIQPFDFFVDTDNDGTGNCVDTDDDNDGIPDFNEVCGIGATSFVCSNNPTGSDPSDDDDNDGTPNYKDADYCTLNANGVCDALDTDGDGIIDQYDLDSDADGCTDALETSFVDDDKDGIIDNYTDTNFNGLHDGVDPAVGGTPLTLLDRDIDMALDFQDIDQYPGSIAIDDNISIEFNTTDDIDVLANDHGCASALDPSSVTNTGVLSPVNGSITGINSSTGEITYDPNPNFTGVDSFEYIICDLAMPVTCDTGMVYITVSCSSSGPEGCIVAIDDETTTDEDVDVDIDVTDNDIVGGNTISLDSLAQVQAPGNGSISINNSTGLITYSPGSGFIGTDSFEYKICTEGSDADITSTFTSTDVPITIPTSGTVTSDLTIPPGSGGKIVDVKLLNLDITHTYIGDLTINLESPSSTSATMISGLCGSNENLDMSFDDGGSTITLCSDLTSGNTFKPFTTPLSTFDTENSEGTWTLTVIDGAGPDGGSINGWELEVTYESEVLGVCDTATVTIFVNDTTDTDGDGVFDSNDIDDDNDGIPDYIEACGSSATDFSCLTGCTLCDPSSDDDNDGTLNYQDADFCTLNANGVCASLDSDGDGIIDMFDLDSDNDGIPDIIEAGGVDTNGDGHVDYPTSTDPESMVDLDNDGLADIYDNTDTQGSTPSWSAGTAITNADSDGDGYADAIDLDADNDGIPDLVEMGGVDSNGDGLVDTPTDADSDGFADVYDPDIDGTAGVDAGADVKPLVETNGSAVPLNGETGNSLDSDGDGYADAIDLDADNDGIPDLIEAGGIDTNGDGLVDTTTDADNDGYADVYDTDDDGTLGIDDATDALMQTGGTDTDADGKADDTAITYIDGNSNNLDKDKDGHPDHLDLDADNDGIPDIVEIGGIDTNGDGRVDSAYANDTDNDGFADTYDSNNGGTPLVETDGSANLIDGMDATSMDSDGDGLADYLDLDADNDGVPDLIEAGGLDPEGDGFVDIANLPWDADGDGLIDIYDTNATDGPDGTGVNGSALLKTSTDIVPDGHLGLVGEDIITGGGGVNNGDADNDGIPNHLDIDADNDGIMDVTETGATDSNNDGRVDDGAGAFVDTDNDGLADGVDGDVGNDHSYETSNPLIISSTDDIGDADARFEYTGNGNADNDGDDVPDYLDVDSDNDGIYDNYEAQSTAGYVPPGTTDSDKDGLLDAYDTTSGASQNGLTPYNHNSASGDLIPDYLDLDSDGDNIPDVQEAWDDIADGDSQCDNISACTSIDSDGDGLVDNFDSDDADAYSTTWAGDPADDTDGTNGTSVGTVFTDDLDVLLPDNGFNTSEPDYRDYLSVCGTAQVYYAVSEQGVESTEYEYNGTTHINGAGTSIIRATTYCEPDADGWYYYYNPLEPGNYLFAVKYNNAPTPVVPMWDIVDYIELKIESDPTNRHVIGATESTFVMERDWNVVFKGTPTTGSTFDVKFYFKPEEMATLDAAADVVEAAASGGVTREFFWFKKAGGLSNSDVSTTGVTNMQDITDNDLNDVNESNSGNTDGTNLITGNAKNYVQFSGLTSFSGGTSGIKLSYAVLPVELSSFEGKADGCEVDLFWETSNENGFSRFDIERSEDGQRFETVETIEGIGGDYLLSYSYTDDLANRANYYRLKMIDLDGTFEYSKVITVNTNCDNAKEEKILVYPNPIGNDNSLLRVSFHTEKTKDVYLLITNALQQSVKKIPVRIEKGQNIVKVDVKDLPGGLYYITLLDKGSVIAESSKIIKIDTRK